MHRDRTAAEERVQLLPDRERRADHRDVKSGVPSVPTIASVRPGWPSLKITTAEAPAVCALSALSWNVHVPRWMSATLPGMNPAKSPGAQPAFDELGVGPGGNWLSFTSFSPP